MAETYKASNELLKNVFGNNSFGLNTDNDNGYLGLGSFFGSKAKTDIPSVSNNFKIQSFLKSPTKATEYDWGNKSESNLDDGNLFGFSNNQISGALDIANTGLAFKQYMDGREAAKLNNQAIKLNIAAFKEDRAKDKVTASNFGKVSSNTGMVG
jgi:hypothetical protein